MDQATRLLNSLPTGAQTTSVEEEPHIIIGSDRFVKVPNSLRRIAVQYDHDVETVTFDCPRYWDDLDMSQMAVYINYVLSDGYMDSYPASDVAADGDIMHFTWTISRNVTQVVGNITFLVCVKKTDSEGVEVNHWNSELCRDMYVSEGLETEEQVAMENTDLVTQLLLRMAAVEQINVTEQHMMYLMETMDGEIDRAESIVYYSLQLNEDIKSSAAEIRNSYADAIKGKESGEIVRVDDVSPLEHDVKVKVHGKNMVNVDFINGESSTDRSVIQKDGDTIIFPAVDGNLYGFYMNNSDLGLKAGKTYTASVGIVSAFNESSYGWRLRYMDGSTVTLPHAPIATFTLEKELDKIIFRIGSPYTGNTESRIANIQIEEGSATVYEPYVDPSTMEIIRCSKNIFPYPYEGTTYANGITFLDNGDGSITMNGTNDGSSNSVFYLTRDSYLTLPTGTYSCSPNISGVGIMGVEKGGGYFTLASVNKKQFTIDEPMTFRSIYIQISKGATDTYDNVVIRPMLELGVTDAVFEECNRETVTPNTDGTCVVKSVHPTTTIFANLPGAKIDIEYNRDTTKMFESYVLTDETKKEIANDIVNLLTTHPVKSISGSTVSLNMDVNTEYRCSNNVTSLTITGFKAGDSDKGEQWSVIFTAGSSINVSVPSTVTWGIAEPVFEAGKTYWLSFTRFGSKHLGVWSVF